MARILVIDDEKIIRNVVRRYLEREGHEIVEAEDGEIGMRIYDKETFDLVITDIIMPNREGIETIAGIKHLNPEAKIIAMTGGGKAGPRNYLQLARRFGASDTFIKGKDWQPLCDMVQHVLAGGR